MKLERFTGDAAVSNTAESGKFVSPYRKAQNRHREAMKVHRMEWSEAHQEKLDELIEESE